MKYNILAFLLMFCLLSCGNRYEYWDISKFKISEGALKDNEQIWLIYSSQGQNPNKELECYIHIIAISQTSGDTVNILTAANNRLTSDDGNRIFTFFDKNNFVSKLANSAKSKDLSEIKNISEFEVKKIDKVARDPKFDEIADNNYPTVIGSIGIYSPKDSTMEFMY